MMDDVEKGKIGVILLKDSSRLGRDHIQVGLAMEIMRQNGVRLIGVDDGLDADVEDDFIPFRNVLHEFYAKDTSRKIKSTFKAKGMSGKHCTGTICAARKAAGNGNTRTGQRGRKRRG
jgi:DNA invertase Pin-like site-specific DNA recombinase